MLNFSLMSAIIGAFITAAFAYFVQVAIAKRGDKKRQQRLAVLYLTRVSQIVATRKALEFALRDQIKQLKEKIDPDKKYLLHQFCIHVVELFRQGMKPSNLPSNSTAKQLAKVSKNWLNQDPYLGYKIDDELLSNLPADAIIQYHFFIGRISELTNTLTSWITVVESDDFSLVDSDILFGQLTGFKKLSDSAEKLRSSLITKGKIKRKKADDILGQQFRYYAEVMVNLQTDQKIIGILRDATKKVQDKPVQTEKLPATEQKSLK